MDATCRAPLAQNQALAEYAPHRSLTKITYLQGRSNAVEPPLYLQTLEDMAIKLCEDGKMKGYSISDDLHKFPTKARAIWDHLGAWASRHFLAKKYQDVARHIAKYESSSPDWSHTSRYIALMTLLKRVLEDPVVQLQAPGSISNKVERLLYFLNEKGNPNFSGVIFVRERVTAYILSALLNAHSLTRNVFRCAPCVSSSAYSESWAKNDALPFEKNDNVVLQFRSGEKNLIIATSVLEEGIDLPACHLVISFDIPDNITSFIQRRGRARQRVSEFVVMEASDVGSMSVDSNQWSILEKQMQSVCLDHQRCHQQGEMDDKQSDEARLELQISTGFAFSLFITRTPADATLSLQRRADWRKCHTSPVSFLRNLAK